MEFKKIKTKDRVEPLPDWLVKDVAKNGHELAFHGYNHVSLLKEDWKNPKFISHFNGNGKEKMGN
jgi:predicted deacetylase